MENQTVQCCAECGEDGGISLKACKSCKSVKYCNSSCQRNHWPTHKKDCKQRAAELRDEALFKDPPAKEDCPICFLPMPVKLISCASLPPATVLSVPIHDFAIANEGLATKQRINIIHVAERAFVKGVWYPSMRQGTRTNVRFAMRR
jgi:hypothetical protein